MTDANQTAALEDAEYVQIEDASPLVGDADFFKHPEHGWVKVLDVVTEIEADIVVAAFGDPVTGEFLGQYLTWYPDTETLIMERTSQVVEDRLKEAPDEVTSADDLVADLQTAEEN